MLLATFSCNPACQERRSITHALLRVFCHNRLDSRIAGASHWIDQRPRAINSADIFGLLWSLQFLMSFMWNRALANVRCTFCRPHLPKVLQRRHFLNTLKWTSGSRFLYTFCRDKFGRWSPETAETETLPRRPRKPLTRKNTGFRARECFHPWIHTLLSCHTSQLLLRMGGWHDDVADMLRHEHDDKTAPGHSSVARKCSN